MGLEVGWKCQGGWSELKRSLHNHQGAPLLSVVTHRLCCSRVCDSVGVSGGVGQ